MHSFSSQAKRRPHHEDSDDQDIHPLHPPTRVSSQINGATTTKRMVGGIDATIATSRTRKSSSSGLHVSKLPDDAEMVDDYIEEGKEHVYTSPPIAFHEEKAGFALSPEATTPIGAIAVRGPALDSDEESQVCGSTVDENTHQNTQDESIDTGTMSLLPSQEPIEARCVSNDEEMRDQAKEIAEMVQKELMASATFPVDVQPGGAFPGRQDVPTNTNQKKIHFVIIVIGLLAVFAAVAVGVGVGVSNKSTDEPVTARVEAFREFLEPISGEQLKDKTSPQYRAMNWLANTDAANVTIGVDPEVAIKTRYVAAVLYYSFQGDIWHKTYNFLSKNDVCSWNQNDQNDLVPFGISCGTDMAIESFRSPANNLKGNIPPEITYLSSLKTIDLINNTIDGNLSNLANLTRLEYLDLTGNACTGTLPSFLLAHKELIQLHLDQNHLEGTISHLSVTAPNLKDLWLRDNLLVGQIPSSIGQSTTLQSIDLTSNQLTGTIPDFASQSKIMQLWLANNKFTGHIPVTTGKLSALQLLDLSANHLTATIPTEIGNCQKIIHFGVNENSLSGTINQVIDLLPSTLESLDASGNLLEGTIPVSVGTLAKVSFLDLQENKVGGTLPSEIGLLSELETLNLAYNKFTGSVPLTLANLSNLVDLRLQGNSLNGSLDWLCIIDFEFFAANTCSEPDEIECTCCTVCCDLGEAYCESIV